MYQSTPESDDSDYVSYVGRDRNGAEFIGNKQTYRHELNFIYQYR